ncbi:hypothetical protein BHM03_00000277 [Ensete ventricosum]|nr:hypothetical protein BHM03_00000277 [Ensete ventricosum]
MAVAGAIVGAGFGGWLSDRFGRRPSIILADLLFFIGAIIMATAPIPGIIILGRIFVGFGVGMASMTAPLYISEASPARIRGALERKEEAVDILRKIYPANEVEAEIEALRLSVEAEIAEEGSIGEYSLPGKLSKALSSVAVRRGLVAGILCQVAQQFVGINTVMYYSPTIVQLAGFASNSTALALSLITSGLNALGSIVSIYFVDRAGRRRLLLLSLIGIITCLALLSGVFFGVAKHSPAVSIDETQLFGNHTCPSFDPTSGMTWTCMDCMRATSECGFCAHAGNKTFLSLTEALGTAPTFLLFCGISAVAFVFIFLLVPETKGLPFEEVEKMLESKDYKAWRGVTQESKDHST